MTQNDIIALARAGFTATQIATLSQVKEAGNDALNNKVQPSSVYGVQLSGQTPANNIGYTFPPAIQGQGQATSQQTPAPAVPAPAQPTGDAKIDELIRTLQASNIINSPQPEAKTADDVLLEIINPTSKEEIK